MITGLVRFFYPDIKKEEVKKFGILAVTLFFILGTYWVLRLLKDVFVYTLAFPAEFWPLGKGISMIKYLKPASVVGVFLASFIYTKLIDKFKSHELFYIIISFYVAFFSCITAIIFIMNTWGVHAVGKYPLAIAGCAGYLLTESYGSLVVALFWSFTVSKSTSDQAKRCFPFVITIAQIGTIIGSSLVYISFSNEFLFGLSLLSLVGVIVSIRYFVNNITDDAEAAAPTKNKKPDMLAGIKLILTQPYLMGVFVVSTFYEVAKTIVDFQMKSQATLVPGVDFKAFVGKFGMAVNFVTFVMALLGTSKLIKRFGLRFCLLLSPIVSGLALVGLYAYYQTSPSPYNLLQVTFVVMVILTAISYAVNNPTKEMMYIPTSKDAKFKAKGLIDILGGRGAKATGASIGGSLVVLGDPALTIAALMGVGTLISVGFVAAWIVAATFVGLKNSQLIKDGTIIE